MNPGGNHPLRAARIRKAGGFLASIRPTSDSRRAPVTLRALALLGKGFKNGGKGFPKESL